MLPPTCMGFRPSRRAAPLKQISKNKGASGDAMIPPFSEGGPIEALDQPVDGRSEIRIPPFSEGGPIEAGPSLMRHGRA